MSLPLHNDSSPRSSLPEVEELPKERGSKGSSMLAAKDRQDMRAPLLATRYRLELHEVKHILKEFDDMVQKLKEAREKHGNADDSAPAIDVGEFAQFLCRVFEVQSVPDETVESATSVCFGGEGQGTGSVMTVDDFLQWYHINMFTVVNSLNSDTQQLSTNSMIYALAKKHHVSTMVIDKVKAKFDHYDSDGSGAIDLNEFRYLLTVLMKVKTDSDLSQDRVLRAWKEIDRRGNGGVDFAEFTDWYLRYLEPSEEDDRGPAETFYDSFNPTVQRHLVLDKVAKDRGAVW